VLRDECQARLFGERREPGVLGIPLLVADQMDAVGLMV
jgi:hypothetical protein